MAFQIRLRPREIGLLEVMAQEQRRRPQEQAAWLVANALEVWAAERDLTSALGLQDREAVWEDDAQLSTTTEPT